MTPQPIPPDAVRVLLADDDAELRSVLARRLTADGFAVAEASDGSEAVAAVRSFRPDLLVLDLWMPGLDGLGVLRELRDLPEASRLAVIVLSGDDEADGRLEALAAGAAAVLLKGGPLDGVVAELETWANRAVGPPFGTMDDEPDDAAMAAPAPMAGEPRR